MVPIIKRCWVNGLNGKEVEFIKDRNPVPLFKNLVRILNPTCPHTFYPEATVQNLGKPWFWRFKIIPKANLLLLKSMFSKLTKLLDSMSGVVFQYRMVRYFSFAKKLFIKCKVRSSNFWQPLILVEFVSLGIRSHLISIILVTLAIITFVVLHSKSLMEFGAILRILKLDGTIVTVENIMSNKFKV